MHPLFFNCHKMPDLGYRSTCRGVVDQLHSVVHLLETKCLYDLLLLRSSSDRALGKCDLDLLISHFQYLLTQDLLRSFASELSDLLNRNKTLESLKCGVCKVTDIA